MTHVSNNINNNIIKQNKKLLVMKAAPGTGKSTYFLYNLNDIIPTYNIICA